MLTCLQLHNLVTIEQLELPFGPGFTALTGETGAGKSIIIGGLELALGERATPGLIRAGATLAVAEAHFSGPFSPLLGDLLVNAFELDFSVHETQLALRREITANGRTRCFINGQLVALAQLKQLGELLIDLHGQHEHQSLFQLGAARRALDAFADHQSLLDAFESGWSETERLRRRAAELAAAELEFARQTDYLDFQLAEFEQWQPQAGEIDALQAEQRRLAHAENLVLQAGEAYALLYAGQPDSESPALLAQLRDVLRRCQELARYEPEFADLPVRLEEHKAALTELAYQLRDYAENMHADPERLNAILSRLDALQRLLRKHGGNEAAMFSAWRELAAQRAQLTADDTERRSIGAALARAEENLAAASSKLTTSRKASAARFAAEITPLLHALKMERARFEVQVRPLDEPAAHGGDHVDFLLAANPGLPLAPLRKIGSGGELSRVMLALKSVLAARDHIPTLVFDEIDAGISGETARRVGRLMETLAASHQLIVITHHAAIAARAHQQAGIRKREAREFTYTEVRPLSPEERLEELARMMGGDLAPTSARALARELMA